MSLIANQYNSADNKIEIEDLMPYLEKQLPTIDEVEMKLRNNLMLAKGK